MPGLSEDDERRAVFVLGNTLFALHHELGHALIDQFDLDPPGSVDEVADAFAVVSLAPPGPDATANILLRSAADGWLLYAETGSIDELTYVDQHRLDEDRFYRTACLFIGADPGNLFEYALDVGLPEDRIERCPKEFAAVRSQWRDLLAPYRPGSGPDPAGSLSLTWEPAPASAPLDRIQRFIRDSGSIDAALARIEDRVALKRDISVVFGPCGAPAADYAAADGIITLCQELLAEFDGLIRLYLEPR